LKAERQEAFDILRKWQDEKSVVRLQASFPLFAFGLWGRILSMTDNELRVMSDDTKSEITLRLTPGLEFAYGDDRMVMGEEKKFSACLVMLFNTDSEPFDTVAIAALKS
jgi:hypothetical protein